MQTFLTWLSFSPTHYVSQSSRTTYLPKLNPSLPTLFCIHYEPRVQNSCKSSIHRYFYYLVPPKSNSINDSVEDPYDCLNRFFALAFHYPRMKTRQDFLQDLGHFLSGKLNFISRANQFLKPLGSCLHHVGGTFKCTLPTQNIQVSITIPLEIFRDVNEVEELDETLPLSNREEKLENQKEDLFQQTTPLPMSSSESPSSLSPVKMDLLLNVLSEDIRERQNSLKKSEISEMDMRPKKRGRGRPRKDDHKNAQKVRFIN